MNIKMLKDLNFAEIISGAQAVTESGREIVKKYAGYLFSNEANYALVNNFLREARQHAYDKGLMEAAGKVSDFINENKTSWSLASVCESMAYSRPAYDVLSKNAIAQVDKLLENLNEAQVNQYIKAGALKNIQYIPEFRNICKGVFAESVTEVQAPNYNLYAPLTFTESVDGTVYFAVAGRTYKNEEGTVIECEAPSKKFITVNRLLESFQKNENSISFFLESRELLFTIDECGCKCKDCKKAKKAAKAAKKGDCEEEEEEQCCESFTETAQFDEYRDIYQRGIMNPSNKIEFMNVTEAVKTVWENFDNIVECDCARVLKTSNGTVQAIIEGQNNTIVNTIQSRQGASFQSYDSIVEAVRDIEKISGVNLQGVFESRINEEVKEAEDAEIQEAMNELKEHQMQERRKRIEQLTEANKNNPMKLAILNKLAKELANMD